jgi:phosphatidylglycerol:prolipoprotein diacylglycerol transferase
MIPYFQIPNYSLPLGLRLDIFGPVAAIGTFVGWSIAIRLAKTYQPGDEKPLREVMMWGIIGGLLGGHYLHLFGYHPEEITFGSLFRIWDGLSSMGGVLGALAGIILYFRRQKMRVRPYLNALALGTAPGWMIARIGCFLVHDHPGVRTDFFLAVNFPAGPRHDLGLYDAFVLGALAILLHLLARKQRNEGFLMGVLAVLYSISRFFLDTLRATDLSYVDKRYLGLTPAQSIVVGLLLTGVVLIVQSRKFPAKAAAPEPQQKQGGKLLAAAKR